MLGRTCITRWLLAGAGPRVNVGGTVFRSVMPALPRFDLQGQVALVTGAARGLGRAIALALAEAGSDVALGLREIASDSGVVAEVVGRGRKALPLQMDMTSPEQIRQAVDLTVQHFGRLDILVNNAGIAPDNLAENVTEKDFDQ